MQQVVPRQARPRIARSLLGYSHLVPSECAVYHRTAFYVIEGRRLSDYSLDGMNDGKRRAILKARRNGYVVSRIADMEPLWADLQSLAASTAARTGYGKAPEYYVQHYTDWQNSMRREFAKPGREWFGAFHRERLGAYLYSYLIEDTMHLVSTKVSDEFMKGHAKDLLFYEMVEYCKSLSECARVSTGRTAPGAPAVDRWKELHGYVRLEMGEYFAYNRCLALVLKTLMRIPRLRRWAEADHGEADRRSALGRIAHRTVQLARLVDTDSAHCERSQER